MSDFNKGDFTQQGVDGHVRATLRLNEKRYVELDLTTNEDARGCTISGNVHDRLNNLDYPIGAAPSGNIEITENTAEGEPLDISQYATATVNVAGDGADLVTLALTLVNNTSDELSIGDILFDFRKLQDKRITYPLDTIATNESISLTVPLQYDADLDDYYYAGIAPNNYDIQGSDTDNYTVKSIVDVGELICPINHSRNSRLTWTISPSVS